MIKSILSKRKLLQGKKARRNSLDDQTERQQLHVPEDEVLRDSFRQKRLEVLDNFVKDSYFELKTIQESVVLPDGFSLNEWLATNVFEAYYELGIFAGIVMDSCSCPTMNVDRDTHFKWVDDDIIVEPRSVTARDYMSILLTWMESKLNDDSIFSTLAKVSFPKSFLPLVKKMFARMFRVYAHIYYMHYAKFKTHDLHIQLNTSFQYCIYFILEFNLVSISAVSYCHDILNAMGIPLKSKYTT